MLFYIVDGMTDNDAVERLLRLVLALAEHPAGLTKSQLIGIAGYSGDTKTAFERDKKRIREELGIDLVSDGQSVYQLGTTDVRLALTLDEQAAVALAAGAWRNSPMHSDASVALIKLGAAGISREDLGPAAGFDLVFRPETANIALLLKAAVAHRLVTFEYANRYDGNLASRTVQPWRLRSARGAWYLLGLDVKKDDTRVFRLSRMQGRVRVESEEFPTPAPDEVDAVARTLPGDKDHVDAQGESAELVTATPNAANLLKTSGWQVDEASGSDVAGRVRLRRPLLDLTGAAVELAAMGDQVQVLEPAALRSAVSARWQGAKAMHQGERCHDDGLPPDGAAPPVNWAVGRPASTNQAERALAIGSFLNKVGFATYEELAQGFAITEEQVRQDLELLWCLEPLRGYTPFDLSLSDDSVTVHKAVDVEARLSGVQAAILAAGLDELATDRGVPVAPAAASALAKLRAALAASQAGVIEAVPPIPLAGADGSRATEVVTALRQAIVSETVVRLTYVDRYGTQTTRDIEPAAIFTDQVHWLLAAWDVAAKDSRFFRIDRILQARPTADRFRSRRARTNSYGYAGNDAFDARVWVSSSARSRLEALPMTAPLQERGYGSVMVSLGVADPGWLVAMALSLGSDAEVLQPDWIRPLVVEAADAALAG